MTNEEFWGDVRRDAGDPDPSQVNRLRLELTPTTPSRLNSQRRRNTNQARRLYRTGKYVVDKGGGTRSVRWDGYDVGSVRGSRGSWQAYPGGTRSGRGSFPASTLASAAHMLQGAELRRRLAYEVVYAELLEQSGPWVAEAEAALGRLSPAQRLRLCRAVLREMGEMGEL